MKVALTGHIPLEYFQAHSSLPVDLMCSVVPSLPDNSTFTWNPRSSQFLNQTGVKHLSEQERGSVIFTANIIKPVNDDENALGIHQQFNFKTVLKELFG